MLPISNNKAKLSSVDNQINRFVGRLDKSEVESHSPELKLEMAEARLDGYEVSKGHTDDEAYLRPDMIADVYYDLGSRGDIFDEMGKEAVKLELGVVSLADVGSSALRKAYVQREDCLEGIRADLLFDDTKMPWHLQRGSALALQTIIDAHDLIAYDSGSESEGLYSTMSGRLPYYDGGFKFGESDGSLNGLSLKKALIQSRQRFYGEEEEDAIKKADEALAKLDTFFKAPIAKDFKDIVAYCFDSLGIRSRKQEVCRAVSAHIDGILEKDPSRDNITLLSVGCGTAQAILEVAADIRDKGIKPSVILLDQDPVALAAAKNLAGQVGLSDAVEIHCERLFDQKGQLFDITQILDGRKIDVAEDTGLREYLPDGIYCNLTSAVWNHLSFDGIMTSGNMNINRPQPEFLNGLMGWRPSVIMRSISKGFELHEKSGIPKGNTKARVTRDGVYTLFFSYK